MVDINYDKLKGYKSNFHSHKTVRKLKYMRVIVMLSFKLNVKILAIYAMFINFGTNRVYTIYFLSYRMFR